MRRLLCLLALASVLLAPPALATELRPIVLDPSYQHDRFVTEPQDHVRHFRAYSVSFDGDDDNVPRTTATSTVATTAATCACGRSPAVSAATPTGTATRS